MFNAHGQMVIDALTGAPVPFASILALDESAKGTSSLEDGSFTLNVPIGTSLRISSIGYKPITTEYTGTEQIILIEKQIAEIEEIVIKADESEAARVIRRCVENRELYAPWKQPYFQCLMYNKYRVDMLRDSLAEPSKLVRMLEKRLEGQTVFFSESAMTYHFASPDRVEEHIIANNVAGFSEAQFNFLPEQLVAFDINQDFLDLLNRHYLLPVSKGSERHYGLHLEETKIHDGDTTWYIQFWPEKSSYDLLRGHFIIHSDGYAIEEYRLTNNKKDHQKFDIYHHFKKFNGRWFPDKMFSNIVMTDLGLNVSVLYDQKTFIDEVAFESIPIAVTDANRIDFAEGAQENPGWIEKYRMEPLSRVDSTAISNVSTTIDRMNVEKKIDLIANLTFGRLPIGKFDLEIARFFWSNKTEGYRPGIGIFTNDHLSKKFELHAFAGYGLGDEIWKYGGGATFHLNENKTASIYAGYEKEIYPISSYIITDAASSILSNFYTDQLDDITSYKGGVKGRLSNWKYDLQFSKSTNTPRYEYQYLKNEDNPLSTFEISEVKLNIDYVRRKFVPFYSYEIELEEYNSTYIDFTLAYAPNNILNSNVNYFRTELFAKRPINFKHWGRVELAIHTGIIFGDQPINRLYIGTGSNSTGIPYQLAYSFNTMAPFSRFASKYVNIFYDHRLVRLFQTRFSAPFLHIAQNSGWGFMDSMDKHVLTSNLDDYRQGYHESGIILESLLRYEAFSILHIGLNLGAWYRWGEYSTGNTKDDLAFKVGFSIHF